MENEKDVREMTADTIGADLLQALLAELRLLPKPWEQLPQGRQDDVIDRLRRRVETNVKMAVHLLAAQGRIVVAGAMDQITIKDGVKAVVKFAAGAPGLHDLFDVAGKEVLVVVANAGDHTGGMDDIHGESDQRAMDLGHEYRDDDGGGMDDGRVIDGEVLGLPEPGDTSPTEAELDEYFEAGYQAAKEGKPDSDCPIVRAELVAQWMSGYKSRKADETDGCQD